MAVSQADDVNAAQSEPVEISGAQIQSSDGESSFDEQEAASADVAQVDTHSDHKEASPVRQADGSGRRLRSGAAQAG